MRWRNHILFWLAYVLFKTFLNVSPETMLVWKNYNVLIFSQLAYLMVKIPLVYGSFFMIDRYLANQWSQWKTAGWMILAFILGILGMSIINHKVILALLLQVESSISIFNPTSLFYHLFTLIFVTGAAISLKLLRRQHRSSLTEVQLQKEKTATELKYLKSQINPHFLFNTLNNIYSLARKNSEQTAESVLKLSKLMRFMLYEANQPLIRIADELKLIQDYIALEKLRYTERLTVEYIEEVDSLEEEIAPLLLIHFVENAFKHGASESRFNSRIAITVKLKDGQLQAVFANSKADTQPEANRKSIGLENIKRQLELVYPHHQLNIQNNPDTFTVTLTISLRKL